MAVPTSTVVIPFTSPSDDPIVRQRDALLAKLMTRRADIRKRQNYYDGRQPLPTAPVTTDEKYLRLAEMGQANVTALIVDAKTERMTVAGVRTANEPAGDIDIWRDYWQANALDEESAPLHDKVLTVGRAFVLVWPNPDESATPKVLITAEDPSEVVVAYRPGSRRERVAALKVYADNDNDVILATMWTVDQVHYWKAHRRSWDNETTTRWEAWSGPDDDGPVAPNPHGIPVVEFRCRPTLTGQPNREVNDSVIKVQDRINKTLFDRLVLSEFQAYPQRYAIGVEEVTDPVSGQPMNPLKPGPDRVWTFENTEDGTAVQIGQLAAADLSQHLAAVEADIDTLASMTKVPAYYLMGKMSNISGDTIRADDAGLVAVVRKHIRVLEGSWEEVLRIAMTMAGDPRADDVALELVWRDPENRSMAEAVDAALKKSTLGIPFEQLLEDIGYSPQKIATMAAMREADKLLAPPPPAPMVVGPAVAGGGAGVAGPTASTPPPAPTGPPA
jgi:hypothetical protein